MRKLSKAVGIMCVWLLAAVPAKAASQYNVTYLGNFSPMAINNLGEVVGFSSEGLNGDTHAVVYKNGTLTDMGTLGGSDSYAHDINDHGAVVGYSDIGSGTYSAFLYSNGTMENLGSLGFTNSEASGINNSGNIVGYLYNAGGAGHAFLYSNGSMVDIGSGLSGNNGAGDINENGIIVGSSDFEGGGYHGVVFSSGGITDLGALGNTNSSALAINSSGQIVGTSNTISGITHAFLYTDGQMIDLDDSVSSTEPSVACDINDNGQVVGAFAENHAFLYTNSMMNDLNDMIDSNLNITLVNAVGINNKGQIVVGGWHNDDFTVSAFLLTPVPEPASYMLLGAGLITISFMFWQKSM